MNEYGLLTHSFNVGIANEYGVNDAIVLSKSPPTRGRELKHG